MLAEGADVGLVGFVVSHSDLCGLFVGVGGTIDARSGRVEHAPVGACVQDPDFDLNLILRDVEYGPGVEAPLKAPRFPLPEDLP